MSINRQIDRLTLMSGVLFFITCTLHYPITIYGRDNIYIIFFVLAVVPLLVNFFWQERWKLKEYIYIYAYFFLVAIVTLLSLVVLNSLDVIKASLSYVFFQLFFFLYIDKFGVGALQLIAKLNMIICVISGGMAFYQMFYDPILFGMYAGTKYEQAGSWGVLRASSLFYSTQVYAAYMACSIVMHDIFLNRGRAIDWLFFVFAFSMGLLSGSTGFLFGLIIYFAFKFAFVSIKIFATVVIIAALSVGAIVKSGIIEEHLSQITPVYRIVKALDASEGKVVSAANSERIDIWSDTIEQNDLFLFGNGIGSASSLVSNSEKFTTESYVLNFYYEGGILLLLAYVVFIFPLFNCKYKTMLRYKIPFMLFFVSYSAFVHVFYAVNLPLVWVMLLGLLCIQRSDLKELAEA